jgi:hypothetical protein
MFERFRRGWELAKASAQVLSADRELLVFPLVSGIASLLVLATFVVPIVLSQVWQGLAQETSGKILAVLVLWLFYFAMSAVAFFFNTALVGAALERLGGGDPTLGSGLRVATSRIGPILGWAAVSATVGLVLQLAKKRGGMIQNIVVSMVGIAWNLATFLVVPILAVRGVGPIDAVKESATLLKRTWGEQVVGAGGIGAVRALVTIGLVVLCLPLLVLAIGSEAVWAVAAVVGVGVLAIVVANLYFSALQGIYTAALYRYATTGNAGFGFDKNALAGAFTPQG